MGLRGAWLTYITSSLVRGSLWALISSASFVTMMTVNRSTLAIPTMILVWGRCAVCLMMALPYVTWKTMERDWTWQLGRGVLLALAQWCTYSAYRLISLHNASLIGTTGPLFSAFMAYFFLKESLNGRKIMALAICYTGGLLAAYHGNMGHHAPLGMGLALLGNISAAGVGTLTRFLASRHHSAANTIVFGLSVPFSLITVTLWYHSGAGTLACMWTHRWSLMLLGVLGVISQTSTFQANRWAPASFLASLEYVRWVMFMVIGILVFQEYPSALDLLGGLFILMGALTAFMAQQHHQRGAPPP